MFARHSKKLYEAEGPTDISCLYIGFLISLHFPLINKKTLMF